MQFILRETRSNSGGGVFGGFGFGLGFFLFFFIFRLWKLLPYYMLVHKTFCQKHFSWLTLHSETHV